MQYSVKIKTVFYIFVHFVTKLPLIAYSHFVVLFKKIYLT